MREKGEGSLVNIFCRHFFDFKYKDDEGDGRDDKRCVEAFFRSRPIGWEEIFMRQEGEDKGREETFPGGCEEGEGEWGVHYSGSFFGPSEVKGETDD